MNKYKLLFFMLATTVFSSAARAAAISSADWGAVLNSSTASTTSSKRTTRSNFSDISVSSYDCGSVIGRGAFGRVVRATRKTDPMPFADGSHLKVAIKKGDRLALEAERRAYLELQSTGAVPDFFGVRVPKSSSRTNVNDNDTTSDRGASRRLCLVMELASHGSLQHFSQNGAAPINPLTQFGRAIFRQSVEKLVRIHSKGWIHGDIKPENILLNFDETSQQWQIKIADLGMATFLDPQGMAEGMRGTLSYIAPEVYRAKRLSRASDWWALGASMFALVSGDIYPHASTLIFDEASVEVFMNYQEIHQFTFMQHFSAQNPHPPRLNPAPEFKSFSHGAAYLRAMSFLDLLQGMLDPDPATRLNEADILNHPYWGQNWQNQPPADDAVNPFVMMNSCAPGCRQSSVTQNNTSSSHQP